MQLLTCVREGVAAEELALLFDYLGAHQRGIQLLRELKAALHDDLVRLPGFGSIQDDSQLPFVVGYILEVVSTGDKVAEKLKLSGQGGKVLYKAAGVLEAFLKRDNNGMRGLMQARALTRAGQYAEENNELDSLQIWNPRGSRSARKENC